VTKNGGVIYFTHPVFSMYYKHGYKFYKQLALNSLEMILQDKLVLTDAPTTAHIYLNYQPAQNRYVLHILHYIPERRSKAIDTIEDLIPLYNIELKVKLQHKPGKVYCAPSGEELDFTDTGDYMKVTVPKVKGHEMIIFE